MTGRDPLFESLKDTEHWQKARDADQWMDIWKVIAIMGGGPLAIICLVFGVNWLADQKFLQLGVALLIVGFIPALFIWAWVEKVFTKKVK